MGFRPEMGCGAMPRPVHLAGQRLRRRPDKCDAGRRPSGRRIPRRRPSGRRIPRPAASVRTRSLCRSSSSHRNRFAGFRREPCCGRGLNSRFAFSAFPCGGGITTLWPLCLCRNNPARGLFRQKNGFLRVGALRRRTRRSLLHTVLFRRFYVGVVSLPSACASYR